MQTILPLLEPLSRDTEAVVKQHLGEQLKILAKVCSTAAMLSSSDRFSNLIDHFSFASSKVAKMGTIL